MSKKIQIAFIIFSFACFQSISFALENFYEEGKKRYNEKKFDEAKFLFQRSIVFNPKEYKSYLYLAKIYNSEKNKEKEEKNIRTVLLLDPTNEEAVFILMKIELKKSNYLEVKKSLKLFTNICKNLCEKEKSILESLKNLEPENDS
jgi:tetratricopeptide (TPR) repeat protein|tara:strand:+ start:481 stop:918 length:438 start_codon:yes stop_codon:yes gene_type:complete